MGVWCGTISGSFCKKLWTSLFYVVLWTIWNIKKGTVFDKAKIDCEHELYQIKLRLGFWMKGWEMECPYSLGDLVLNLEGVYQWKKKSPRIVRLPSGNRLFQRSGNGT